MKNENNRTIRIVIADDHEVIRAGIHHILKDTPDIRVIGEADNGEDAQKLVIQLQPDILLLDLIMPGIKPYQIDKWVRQNCFKTSVLILTAHDRDGFLSKAIDGGVVGFISKEETAFRLIQAIRNAASGKIILTNEQFIRANHWRLEVEMIFSQLSKREHQVIGYLVMGWDNREISQEMCLSLKTVEVYVSNILHKLGVSSRQEAVVWITKNMPFA